jgi:hypothetical protein
MRKERGEEEKRSREEKGLRLFPPSYLFFFLHLSYLSPLYKC